MDEAQITDMIQNPEKYGFSWGYGSLQKKGMVIATAAPYIVHRDLKRMTEVFGEQYFLESANGQSARVRDQTLREDIWDNKSLASNDLAMKRLVLDKALGKKRARKVTVIEKRIYVADDGTEFEDKAEYLAYQADLKINS